MECNQKANHSPFAQIQANCDTSFISFLYQLSSNFEIENLLWIKGIRIIVTSDKGFIFSKSIKVFYRLKWMCAIFKKWPFCVSDHHYKLLLTQKASWTNTTQNKIEELHKCWLNLQKITFQKAGMTVQVVWCVKSQIQMADNNFWANFNILWGFFLPKFNLRF